ncbi:hypothetical protein B0H13DRAFT_2351124 [Mycena leptocephala]|nr:hypothetical protein B0H13DRAFT_2351124 [Mycena leptocephala]
MPHVLCAPVTVLADPTPCLLPVPVPIRLARDVPVQKHLTRLVRDVPIRRGNLQIALDLYRAAETYAPGNVKLKERWILLVVHVFQYRVTASASASSSAATRDIPILDIPVLVPIRLTRLAHDVPIPILVPIPVLVLVPIRPDEPPRDAFAADYSFAAVTHYQTQLILSVFGSTLPKMAGFCLWISTIRKRGRHHQPARHKQPTGSLLYFGTLLHSNLYPNFIHPSSVTSIPAGDAGANVGGDLDADAGANIDAKGSTSTSTREMIGIASYLDGVRMGAQRFVPTSLTKSLASAYARTAVLALPPPQAMAVPMSVSPPQTTSECASRCASYTASSKPLKFEDVASASTTSIRGLFLPSRVSCKRPAEREARCPISKITRNGLKALPNIQALPFSNYPRGMISSLCPPIVRRELHVVPTLESKLAGAVPSGLTMSSRPSALGKLHLLQTPCCWRTAWHLNDVVLGVGVVKTTVLWVHRSGLTQMYASARYTGTAPGTGAPRHAAGARIIELQGHGVHSSGQRRAVSSVSRSLGQEMFGEMGKMKGGGGNTKIENVIQTIITQEEETRQPNQSAVRTRAPRLQITVRIRDELRHAAVFAAPVPVSARVPCPQKHDNSLLLNPSLRHQLLYEYLSSPSPPG